MLFVRDAGGLLVGLLCARVDDVLIGGSGAHYEAFKKALFKMLRLKEVFRNVFKYLKRKIERLSDGTILVSFEHLDNIKPIYISRERRRQSNEKLTPDETSSLRSLIGELGWPTREGFPEFCYDVSDLQQRVPEATVSTMIRASSVLRDLQHRARKPALRYVRGDGSGQIAIGLYNDASFDRQPRGGSQQGYIVVLGGKDLAIQEEFYASPIAWSSTKIHRVVRSTLAAEAAALATGYDTAVYIRAIVCYLLGDWSGNWMEDVAQIPQVTWTDCRSLYDCLNKEGSTPSEKRIALDIYDVRQFLERDYDALEWCSTNSMIADPLTKHIPALEATPLRSFLETGFLRPTTR